jgi:hypothetical protein
MFHYLLPLRLGEGAGINLELMTGILTDVFFFGGGGDFSP